MGIALRGVIFILSTIGFWELIRRVFDIKACYIPSVTVAAQVSLLFFAGLLNLLPEMVICLFFLGFLGLGISIADYYGLGFLNHYREQSFLFLLLGMLLVTICVHGKLFSHYDNFTHWALVVRRMLETNRFPNFMDSIIGFKDYPLGSSVYIYFFCKLTNETENVQMLAQAYMMLICLMPLFYYANKDYITNLILIFTAANFFLVFCIPVSDLLVDTLLALVAATGVVYTVKYEKSDKRIQYIPILLFLIQLLQIKNSGIYFAVIILLLILIGTKRSVNRNWCILSGIVPFFTVLLWHKHVTYVFQNVGQAKHAMSPGRYKEIFGEKTISEIRTILLLLIKQSITWKPVIMTAGLIVIVGIVVWVLKKEKSVEYIKIAFVLLISYIGYQIGMFGMYLFSMPKEEALRLAGFDRYTKTFLVFAIYLCLMEMLRIFSNSNNNIRQYRWIAFSFMLMIVFHMQISLGSVKTIFNNGRYEEQVRERLWIEKMKVIYSIPEEASYTILIPESDAGYSHYLGKYVFCTDNVHSIVSANSEVMNQIKDRYVLIYDEENEAVKNWIADKYPEQSGNDILVLSN